MNRNLNPHVGPRFNAPGSGYPYRPQQVMAGYTDEYRGTPVAEQPTHIYSPGGFPTSHLNSRAVRQHEHGLRESYHHGIPMQEGAASRYLHDGSTTSYADGRFVRQEHEHLGAPMSEQIRPRYSYEVPNTSYPDRRFVRQEHEHRRAPVLDHTRPRDSHNGPTVSHSETSILRSEPRFSHPAPNFSQSERRLSQPEPRFSHATPRFSHLDPRFTPAGHSPSQERFTQENVVTSDTVISGHRDLWRNLSITSGNSFDSHADRIVAKMEQNESLMEDTPTSEQLRREALRDMPQFLTMKRFVKMKLKKSVSQKSKQTPIGFFKHLKYSFIISFAKFKSVSKNFNYFELWQGTLKHIEGRFGSGYASYFKFLRWLFVMNLLVCLLCFAFLVVPQIIFDASGNNGTWKNNEDFQFRNIFIGDGFFRETVLYYGHYTNESMELVSHVSFDMPAAYFSLNVVLYLLSIFVLGVSVTQSYRRNFIETEGRMQHLATRILCGWDFGIATEEAAKLKSSAIYNELIELQNEAHEEQDSSRMRKFWTYSIHVIVNILVLVILAAVCWSSLLLLENFSLNGDESVLASAAIINIVIMILPMVFDYMSKYEEYNNPRTSLYITLTRTYLLGCVIIGAILVFWFNKADVNDIGCWESHFAAEIYRLILFDFIFSVVLATLIEIVVHIIRRLFTKDAKYEFNIAKHTLQIIYNQALFWVGLFYSPILPVIVTLKMCIIWYINEWCVRKLYIPPKKTWRAAQTQTWFMVLTFISILLIIVAHGYTWTSIPTSRCGPLQDYHYVYQILTQNVANLEENYSFWKVVVYIAKPGSVALIMIGFCVLVYVLKEQAHAQREKVEVLREMLLWMAKDKKFLVQYCINISKGRLDPFSRDARYMDPSLILPREYEESFVQDDLNSRFKKHE